MEMSGRTKALMIVSVLIVIATGVVYFGPRYGIDIGRFFASGPVSSTPPTTNTVKLYPVFDQATSKVRFVLDPGNFEILGFQFKAGITSTTFTNIGGFVASSVLNYPVLPAVLTVGNTVLSYAAGVPNGTAPGLTGVAATVATIDYIQPSNQTTTEVCVTVDMANTVISARGQGANVLDMTLAGWSNVACFTTFPTPVITTFTATPDSLISGQNSLLAWTVSGTTSVSIDNGVGVVSGSSVSVSPTTTTTYTLTATGPGGTATASVTVTVLPPIRGDVNGDRVVDIMDFTIVVANFERVPSATVLGDENNDGKINILDFGAVVTFFGRIIPR